MGEVALRLLGRQNDGRRRSVVVKTHAVFSSLVTIECVKDTKICRGQDKTVSMLRSNEVTRRDSDGGKMMARW